MYNNISVHSICKLEVNPMEEPFDINLNNEFASFYKLQERVVPTGSKSTSQATT